jgi:hypothetical protein
MAEFTKSEPNFVILHENHGTKAEDALYTDLYNKFSKAGHKINLRTHDENIINSRVNIIKTLKDEIKSFIWCISVFKICRRTSWISISYSICYSYGYFPKC